MVRLRPDVFEALDGKRIFLTGGTGFVGGWMLRALAAARQELAIHCDALVLTRDSNRFLSRYSELEPYFTIVEGDAREPFPVKGRVDLIVHAASETNATMQNPSPSVYLDVAFHSAMQVAALAQRVGTPRILFVSSGAAYGAAAFEAGGAAEDATDAPSTNDPRAAYGNAKRASEAYLSALNANSGTSCVIARLFAFVGPGLPLDAGYAIGNFIRDGLRREPIVVKGDGTPRRSYMYASDLAVWLWTAAVNGEGGRIYNVGSEEELSIAELAVKIANACGGTMVNILGIPDRSVRPSRYVPSTRRTRELLGLSQTFSLDEAIERTIEFHRAERLR